jgi:ribulose-phosphate 3-epimerase
MKHTPEIMPSILSADFSRLGSQLADLADVGARAMHVDVMDGHFVPNITYGPVILRSLNSNDPSYNWDVHLMVEDTDKFVPWFQMDRVSGITVHQESCPHLHRTLGFIRDSGLEAGVSLNPSTPICTIQNVLGNIDQVLVMTVNPGFGGQSFIPAMMKKIKELATLRERMGLDFHIQVDGGIDKDTAPKVVSAGADRLVVGNGVFSASDIKRRFQELTDIAKQAAD